MKNAVEVAVGVWTDAELRSLLAQTIRKMREGGWTVEQVADAVNDGHSAYEMAEAMKS